MTKKIIFIISILVVLVLATLLFFPVHRSPKQTGNAALQPSASSTQASTGEMAVSSTSSLKTYTNTDFGFQFQYPSDWSFASNTFGNPASKFNLVGISPEENGHPDPIDSPLLINIVTSDFANNAKKNIGLIGPVQSTTTLAGLVAPEYIYPFEGETVIDVFLPLSSTTIIFEGLKRYENVFNQMLASFKFLD